MSFLVSKQTSDLVSKRLRPRGSSWAVRGAVPPEGSTLSSSRGRGGLSTCGLAAQVAWHPSCLPGVTCFSFPLCRVLKFPVEGQQLSIAFGEMHAGYENINVFVGRMTP